MKTYQDLIAVGDDTKERMDFVKTVINEHKASDDYETARVAYEYYCHRNVTINNYQKILFKASGEAIEDIWGANYKMGCRHFYRFVTQENQFLLGNGVQWGSANRTATVRVKEGTPGAKEGYVVTATDGKGSPTDGYKYWYVEEKRDVNTITTADKLGNKKYPFDNQLQELGAEALWGGVAYGFFDYDHIMPFSILEFAKLEDEETGALRAGVRFWQIDDTKPQRATLYEEDGYTHMMFYASDFTPSDDWNIVQEGYAIKEKQKYITRKSGDSKDKNDNTEVVDGENYPSFPIVPLYANPERQSEIVGLREQIDCYDFIKSGLANSIDEASFITWIVKGAEGMDDVDLAKFIEQVKTVHATDLPSGADATPTTLDAPFNASVALLEKLDQDLYKDAMALDTERIASGATTATQIRAAYEPLNSKVDSFEYCVLDFIYGILELTGIEDEASFTRSMIVNVNEDIQTVLQASANLTEDYVTTKILTLLGDGDKAEEIINQMNADELERFDDTGETNGD